MTDEQLLKNLEVPSGPVDAVLDTDTFNETDDQFALSYLLLSGEKIHTKAIYAAPFLNERSASPKDGMEKSFGEILKILSLAGRDEMRPLVFRGSEDFLADEKTPRPSAAAEHLAELAMHYSAEKPLYVLGIAAITNVASALLLRPEIRDRIVLVWLGGNPQNADEFNMRQDIAAARIVFGSGVPLVQLPCADVVENLHTTAPELRYWLGGKNRLSDFLCRNTIEAGDSYAAGKPWSRTIWDISAVAWLLNDGGRFLRSRVQPAQMPEYDLGYSYNPERHPIRFVCHVKRDAVFADLFQKLTGSAAE